MNSPESTSSASIDRYIEDDQPFAIISKQDTDDAYLLSGEVQEYDNLTDITRSDSNATEELQYNTLSLIPYAQAREAGLAVKEGDCRIRCMKIQEQTRLNVDHLLDTLPQENIAMASTIEYSETEAEYADIVRRVIEEQIKEGNLCNCVISTEATGGIADMNPKKALSIFRKILQQEFGAYLTFFVYDGESYHIGASPERQLTIDQGEVHMNPISGTLRKENREIDREKFLAFLRNPKEQNELFMCLDEELKQMAQMCETGGFIVGPLLKEMSKLVHTEYELVGKSDKDLIDLLRTSLHAPTVTGSPRQAAHQTIADMESISRRYYAGSLAVMGNNTDGSEFLDGAIMIRTMNITPDGLVRMRVGSSIVRDSIPEEEAKEGRAKLAGITAGLISDTSDTTLPQLSRLMDDEIQLSLEDRNLGLNRFLIEDQTEKDVTVPELKGKRVVIINYEDDFSFMLGHMATAMGIDVTVIPYEKYDPTIYTADITIVGPGPGNPLDGSDEKMKTLGDTTSHLMAEGKKFLSVCLGHQKLCEQLGFSITKKADPTQGVAKSISLYGNEELVGFYNTFAAVNDADLDGIDVSADDETGEIHALRGSHFSSFQFHPESIFSENGFEILANELKQLVA